MKSDVLNMINCSNLESMMDIENVNLWKLNKIEIL